MAGVPTLELRIAEVKSITISPQSLENLVEVFGVKLSYDYLL
jgi:hypothetical protein